MAVDVCVFSYGLWPMAYGLWPMAYGLWPMAYGLWPMAYGLWPMAYGLWPMAYFISTSLRVKLSVSVRMFSKYIPLVRSEA